MILHGVKEISGFLNCSRNKLRSLVRAGAPIKCLGDGDTGTRYIADTEALLAWVRSGSS